MSGFYNVIKVALKQVRKTPRMFEVGVENVIEKYKGIRRLLLFFITYMNVDAYFFTKQQYIVNGSVDTEWIVYQGILFSAWSIFFTFYTRGRTEEFHSDTPYSKKGQWMGGDDVSGV